MRIPQNIIEEIHQAMDIVEVVSDYVSLKKSGSNYKALSPFTNEKTASFFVSPSKQIFKCFSSGKGGNAVTFVMEVEGVPYPAALKHIAEKYNIELPSSDYQDNVENEEQNEKESILIALDFACKYFREQLHQTIEGQNIGISYFKERGILHPTIEKFKLGFSTERWDQFYQYAVSKGFKADILEKAGLILSRKENDYYDRFRDRVIFPIHNLSGKVIAFGARALKKNDKTAKYINSPETPVYHKSKVLYGLNLAKQSIRLEDFCLLVEGYTDVIALHQAGIENVVASSGTSLTIDQIRLIKRFTKNITMIYDGDDAGIKASLRGIDLVLEEGLQIKIVVLPDNEDPDSYIHNVGTSQFKQYIAENAVDFITFKTHYFLRNTVNDPIQKSLAIREVVDSIVKIPDTIQQSVFFKKVSELFGVEEQMLINEGNKIKIKEKVKESDIPLFEEVASQEIQVAINPLENQERESLRLLLRYADYSLSNEIQLCHYLLEEIEGISFQNPVYQSIIDIFKKELQKGNIINANYFIHNNDPDIQKVVVDLIADQYTLSTLWQEKYEIHTPKQEDMLVDTTFLHIMRLKFRVVQKMILENLESLKQQRSEETQAQKMQIHMQLKQTEKEIAEILGNIVR